MDHLSRRGRLKSRAAMAGVVALISMFVALPARAINQNAFFDHFHTAWTQVDGAPAEIHGIVQDKDGWLWLGGASGLYRFDGERFERIQAIGASKLHRTNILALAMIDGSLWIGYQFGGIEHIENGTTTYFDAASGIPGGIYKIMQAPDGHVLASTGVAIYQLNGKKWSKLWPLSSSIAGVKQNMLIAPDKSLLFLAGGAVYRRAFGDTTVEKVASDGDNIVTLSNGPDGSFFASALDGSLLHYTAAAGRFQKAVSTPATESPPSLFFQRDGTPWMVVAGGIQLLGDVDTFAMRGELTPEKGLSGRSVASHFEDREGNLWLGTSGGIDRIRRNRITVLALPKDTRQPGIAAGSDGAIWVSSANQTALRKIGANGVSHDTTMVNVQSIMRSRDGVIWAANEKYIARYDSSGEHRWPLQNVTIAPVQSMAQLSDGSIWLSNVGHPGLAHFKNGQWEPVTTALGYKSIPIYVFADEHDRLWQTYTDNRIAVADGNKVSRYGEKDGLRTDNVLTLLVHGEHVWVGGEKALMYFSNGRFNAVLDKDGKDFIGISGIVESPNGDLWLNGQQGITHILAAQLRHALLGDNVRVASERFDAQDGIVGLPAQIRPVPSLVEGADHRLWYSTMEGVGWLDPQHIKRNVTAPEVVLRDVVTDGKSYLTSAGLVLPAGTQNIRIDYTALGLAFPSRMSFRYRLDGVDSDWVDAGNRRSAYYTNLGPGRHHFAVSAANEDGVWNTAGAGVEFAISPTLTQTIWFRLLCVIAALALLWCAYVLRQRQISARNQMRTEVRVGERERIARELHDTLLQSVQGLVLKVHGAAELLPSEEPMRLMLNDALRNAEDAMVEGRNRVRQLRDYGEELPLTLMFRQLGQTLTKRDGPKFTVSASASERALLPHIGQELYAIGREAMLNALNHANAAAVNVDLSCMQDEVRLTVWDDGHGIPSDFVAAKGRPGHWGVQGMRERATRIGATFTLLPNEMGGTECSVNIPGSLAYPLGPVEEKCWIFQQLAKIRNSTIKRPIINTD